MLPQPQSAMALCRFVFGISLGLHYLSVLPQLGSTYGPDSIGGARFHEHVPWATGIARLTANTFEILSYVNFPTLFQILLATVFFASLAFAAGFKTRYAGTLALIIHTLLHGHSEYSFWGWGEMIKPFFLYVLFSDSGRWYSVDSWLRERQLKPQGEWVGPGWPVRLVQIHVSMMYLQTAWIRLDDPNWLNGSMLQGILTDSIFSRVDSDFMNLKIPLQILCYLAWLIELAAPITLWLNWLRIPTAILLILMHVGLELTTLVGYWNFIMIAAISTFLCHHRVKLSIPPGL